MSVVLGNDDHDMLVARPKRNNPNVEEVFVEQQQQQAPQPPPPVRNSNNVDTPYDAMLGKYVKPKLGLRLVAAKTRTNLPVSNGKDKEEEDDNDVIMMDGPPPPSSAAHQKRAERDSGKDDPGPAPLEEEERRKELIDFEAAKRHLEAKARMLSDPVVQFVSGIAVKTGSSLQNMLVNPSLPLVNVKASSIDELIGGSRMSREYLLVLLAQVLVEQQKTIFLLSMPSPAKRQKGDDADDEPVDDEDEMMLPVVTPQKPSAPFAPSAPSVAPAKEELVVVKDEPVIKNTVDAAVQLIDRAIDAHTVFSDGQYELIGVPPPQQNPAPPGIFRIRGGGGGGGGGGPVTDGLSALLKEVAASSDVAAWAWNQMPENSGLALIKPEVLSIIQMAYEDIRAISAHHATFKLWHLITGPRVRQHFSMMIAGMLNAAPSELQYPHYQRSVRDNGAVTGSRVSTGIMTTIRSAALYKEKLLWFKSVGYQESAQWKALRERQAAGTAQAELVIARNTLDRCEAELVRQMNAFWASLDPVTRERTGDLYDASQRPLEAMPDAARRAIRRELIASSPRTPIGSIPTIGRVIGANATALVPFAPGYEVGSRVATPYQPEGGGGGGAPVLMFTRRPIERLIGSPERPGESELVYACTTALAELEAINRRVASWSSSVASHQQVIYNLTGAFERFKAALLAIKTAARQVVLEQRQMAAITEDAKVELIYTRIDTRPSRRDYSIPYSRYATE